MFITAKRHEREKQELLGASNRLTEAILANSEQGLFLLDGTNKIQPQVSQSLAKLVSPSGFQRSDFRPAARAARHRQDHRRGEEIMSAG